MTGRRESRRTTAYFLLAAGSAGYVCFTFVWFTLPAYLTTIVSEVGLSGTAAGIVVGAVPLTYVPFALVSGLLIDRIGPRRAIGAGLLLIGLGQAGRSIAGDFPTFFVTTAVIGLGGTGITFGLPKLVAVLFPSAQVGRASSVYMVGSYAGMAAAFALGRSLLGPALGGWRPLFLWSGVLVSFVSVAWLLFSGELGMDRRGRDSAERGIESIREDVHTLVTHRGMRLLVVVGTMSLVVVHGTMGWLTAILEGRGFDAGVAAATTTTLVVARLVGTVAIPTLSDLSDARRAALVGSGGLLVVGVGGLLVSGSTLITTVAAVVAIGLGLGGLLTLVRVLPIEYPGVGPDLTGTATGLIYTVGQVGGFLGPFLLGALFAATGTFTVGLVVLAIAAAVTVVASAVMPEIDG